MNVRTTKLLATVLLSVAVVPSVFAWGGGHDTVGKCVLKKLPPEWQARFRPEWTRAYGLATHLPDNGDPKVLKPSEFDWLAKNCGLTNSSSLFALHQGTSVYYEFERLVNAIRTGDDYSVFIYLASLSHTIADGAACNHDPIIHLLTYTWTSEGSPQGRGLPVLPKTGRGFPVDFAFAERDADTKAVLARRLAALEIPDPPADITLEQVFALLDRWEVLSMERDNQNSQRIIEAGAKWVLTGDVAAKCAAADALCDLGFWSVERTPYLFKAALALAARPDFAPMPADAKKKVFAKKGTNEVEILRRPMANDSFARPYFAEPGRPSRMRVMYSPIDHMAGSIFDPVARPFGCQIVGSLKKLRPELNASLMDAREFAKDGLDPAVTPVIVIFRRFFGYRGFDAKGFEKNLRAYEKAGGKVIWINGAPPDYLIGKDVLKALRDSDRRDGYCDPRFPVPLDELMKSSFAWIGPGEKRDWKYVHKPNNLAGWHWVGSPQWFDVAALPKDAVPLTELRAPGTNFVTGVACGNCAYIPLNAIFAYCLTDDRPSMDPFCLRLDSAGEAMFLSTLEVLLPSVSIPSVACENVRDADLGDLVRIRAVHSLTRADVASRRYACRFVFRNANGDTVVRWPDLFDGGSATVTLDAADLPAGVSEFTCVVGTAVKKGVGYELGSAKTTFTPVANPVVRRDAPQRTKDAKPGEPVIVRLGTTAVGEVESNPIVLNGTTYVVEHARWKKVRVRRYPDLAVATPVFNPDLQMPCGFAADGRAYVTGTRELAKGVHGTFLIESDDLRTWTKPRLIVSNLVGVAYNTTATKTEGHRYVLATEWSPPKGVRRANPGYQMAFAESTDLRDWRRIPDTAFVPNAGSPCLRYHDGWYYFFHLHSASSNPERRPIYFMRVARSRDLKAWDISPKHVLDPVHEDRRPYPGATFSAAERVRMMSAENRNASDIDMCECGKDLLITYSWGNQLGDEYLALALVRGMGEKEFCESFYRCFPRNNDESGNS